MLARLVRIAWLGNGKRERNIPDGLPWTVRPRAAHQRAGMFLDETREHGALLKREDVQQHPDPIEVPTDLASNALLDALFDGGDIRRKIIRGESAQHGFHPLSLLGPCAPSVRFGMALQNLGDAS